MLLYTKKNTNSFTLLYIYVNIVFPSHFYENVYWVLNIYSTLILILFIFIKCLDEIHLC